MDLVGLARSDQVDSVAIEIATGLSHDDITALKQDGSEEALCQVALKFALQYDRLYRGKMRKLTDEILTLFARNASKEVRRHFAEGIKTSRYLSSAMAVRLACDDLAIAAPILEASPALTESDLVKVIKDMPEPYALAIAGRRPLGETLTDLLLEEKGTARIVRRLLENGEAMLGESALDWIFEWSQSDPEIAEQLRRRPNLPFEMTQKHISALGEQLQWNAITTHSMSKHEATQLLSQMSGQARAQLGRQGARLTETVRALEERHETGELTPAMIIGFLRDRELDLVEYAFATVAGLNVRRIRNLLYGGDKRGLVALCLKAGFTTSEYLVFRMALGLAEIGAFIDAPKVTYETVTTQYAQAQFEDMRRHPERVDAWIEAPSATPRF